MKKLIVSTAVIVAALVTNAAAVRWNSGTASNGFKDHDGNSLAGSTNYTMTVSFYSDSAAQSPVTDGSVSVAAPNGSYGTTTAYEDFKAETQYYVKAVIVGGEEDDQYQREADLASFTMKAQGNSNINFYTGDGFDTTSIKWGEWKSVPEPTSGVLLLLGMAGLALKRKRA